MAITPRRRSPSLSAASFTHAPRSLKALVTCRFSYLTKTSAPVRAESGGAGNVGVRSTCPAITRRAASISASVTTAAPLGSSFTVISPHPKRPTTIRLSGLFPDFRRRYNALRTGGVGHVLRTKLGIRFWTRPQRHRRRPQAARLRSGDPSRVVRGRADTARRRLHYRRDHHCRAAYRRFDFHLRPRHRHLGSRLGAVLAAVAGFGDLGAALLRDDPRQPGFGDARHAGDGYRDAHLVRRAGLFRARCGARHRLLDQRQRADAADPCGRLLQSTQAAL